MGLFSKTNYLEKLSETLEKLRLLGFEKCNSIFAIDYTASNDNTGMKSYDGNGLHDLGDSNLNPYQYVIKHSGTAIRIDTDNKYPMIGFGDELTTTKSVFTFFSEENEATSADGCLDAYNEITSKVTLSGPTTFGPAIRYAIDYVRRSWEYTVLFLICDGAVQQTMMEDTVSAIVEARNYPISIVCIGVGDGPFGDMQKLDDKLKSGHKYKDNFQFVNATKVRNKVKDRDDKQKDAYFAYKALEELPKQYEQIIEANLLNKPVNLPKFSGVEIRGDYEIKNENEKLQNEN